MGAVSFYFYPETRDDAFTVIARLRADITTGQLPTSAHTIEYCAPSLFGSHHHVILEFFFIDGGELRVLDDYYQKCYSCYAGWDHGVKLSVMRSG
jgi:hypothetical protein